MNVRRIAGLKAACAAAVLVGCADSGAPERENTISDEATLVCGDAVVLRVGPRQQRASIAIDERLSFAIPESLLASPGAGKGSRVELEFTDTELGAVRCTYAPVATKEPGYRLQSCSAGALAGKPVQAIQIAARFEPGASSGGAGEHAVELALGDVEGCAATFLREASASGSDEHEALRQRIERLGRSRAVSEAMCAEAFSAIDQDHTRALVALSIVGEMRNASGFTCLSRVLHLPWPATGTCVGEHPGQCSEILEQTSLAKLQASAAKGLAYLQSKEGDAEVLRAVAEHPHPLVRVEAMTAFRFNHGDSPEARQLLASYVRSGDESYLDIVRRDGLAGQEFNQKLEAFRSAHPEAATRGAPVSEPVVR